MYLLEKEAGDRKIVEPAVILHDGGRSQLKPETIKIASGVNAEGEKAKQLNPIHEVRYRFLTQNVGKWFFTETAKELANRELQQRVKENGDKSGK